MYSFFTSCEKDVSLKKDVSVDKSEKFEKNTGIEKEKNRITTKNGRIVFENTNALKEVYVLLNSKSKKEIDIWSKQYNYTNLQTVIESLKLKNDGVLDSINQIKYGFIPETMTNFLNEKCELQINDTIIWINNNYEYIITNGNENLLVKVKNLVNSGKLTPLINGLKIHKITKTAYPNSFFSCDNQIKSLSGSWLDAKYQDQFQPGNGHEYKIIHETSVYQWQGWVVVELHIKFEYWKDRWPAYKSGWAAAGENVTKQINNVTIYVESAGRKAIAIINCDPITDGIILNKGAIFTYFSIEYVKISGEMDAYVPQFNRTYNVTGNNGVLWEKYF